MKRDKNKIPKEKADKLLKERREKLVERLHQAAMFLGHLTWEQVEHVIKREIVENSFLLDARNEGSPKWKDLQATFDQSSAKVRQIYQALYQNDDLLYKYGQVVIGVMEVMFPDQKDRLVGVPDELFDEEEERA